MDTNKNVNPKFYCVEIQTSVSISAVRGFFIFKYLIQSPV